MGLSALTKALKSIGAADLARELGRAGGAVLLDRISEMSGIDLSADNFDEIAADWAYRNRQQVMDFQREFLQMEIEDRQHARDSKQSNEHKYLVAFVVGGSMFSIVGTLLGLIFLPLVKPNFEYPDQQMILIASIINFMMGTGVGVFIQYVFGTSRSSASKNEPLFQLARDIQSRDSQPPPIRRPEAMPAIADQSEVAFTEVDQWAKDLPVYIEDMIDIPSDRPQARGL